MMNNDCRFVNAVLRAGCVMMAFLGIDCAAQATEEKNSMLPEPVFAFAPELQAGEGIVALGAGQSIPGVFRAAGKRPALESGTGVGERHCLSFATCAAQSRFDAPAFGDPQLTASLNGALSFTVAGWFQVDPVHDDGGHDYAFHSPWLSLFFHEQGKDAGALKINGQNGGSVLWTTSNGHFVTPDRWIFYAFTYDGTRTQDNCLSYTGADEDPVRLTWTASADSGALRIAEEAELVLGAANVEGRYGYPGRLGPLRIYASRDSERPALLTLEQLEALRQTDLGPEWPQRLAARRRAQATEIATRHERLRTEHYSGGLNVVMADCLDTVFPDRLAQPSRFAGSLHAARGGSASWQFVVHSPAAGPARVVAKPFITDAGKALLGEIHVSAVRPVPVEANTNGGSRTAIGRRPPEAWLRQFIREAPFEVAEVIAERGDVELEAGRCQAVLVTADVDRKATPGIYRSSVRVSTTSGHVSRPIELRVHRTQLPEQPSLNVTYWLSPDPKDLGSGPPPAWWSEEHWRLIENTARTLRWFGQDCIFTPTIKGKHPLVETTRLEDGSYEFDFARFDRWMNTFLRLGFSQFHGHHVVQWGAVYGTDAAKGTRGVLVSSGKPPEFLPFLEAFYRALGTHLERNQWTHRYLQHQIDETDDVDRYRVLTDLLRSCLPGVRTIDAINKRPEEMTKMVDVSVLAVVYLQRRASLIAERRKTGKTTWFYNCCSPPPPYPNRHLDETLTNSRLYPWIAYRFGVDGYLNWGANIFRGADPYRTSVGPVPNGSQDPGHPPGDNWHFYPTPDGLVGGMRMMAFRDGLQDHALLTLLAARDSDQADAVARRMIRTLVRYERQPEAFHKVRAEILEALDRE
ncbi:MAG: DUF4091 domain-containing protein [Lentisphaerae bacterium]|jgi:hypothetical protein|nr:DUF4091 domain-containing protein [Lentisphaerota bacterium]MBT5611143.1 DUF4091 domain-containing protein [Lentisphaerota bacterium]MBT7059833.1 DUF4091 domain-containing protein [Lentisphaerota bacterium]MBT7844036.1 DUF4091 domain-containing protein [Lentisphaerota bacterium]